MSENLFTTKSFQKRTMFLG